MTTSSPSNNDEPQKNTDTPSVDLAKLRKKAGLSLDDMSRHLKLNRDLLQRLERGETEFLGATAYIRGYLKNYAKILGVPEQELIDGYPLPEERVPRISTQYAIANVAPRRRSSGHFLGYLLGTLVVAAFAYGIWYMMSQGQAVNGLDVRIGPLATQVDKMSNGNQKQSDFHYSSLLPPPPEKNNEIGPVLVPAPSGNAEPDTGQSPADTESVTEPVGDKAPGSDTDTAQTQSTEPEAGDDLAEVVVTVAEAAWVSFRQADGKRLEHNLLQPGEYRYQARLPLHFRFGNASQVQLRINDQPVALQSHMRQDVADFQWPGQAAQVATN